MLSKASKHTTIAQWQALQVFCLYRFLLASTFSVLLKIHIGPTFLGPSDELAYAITTHTYIIVSFMMMTLSLLKKPDYRLQVIFPIFIDIIAIIILMHTSGGILSGLGLLLIINAAAQGLLLPGKIALLSAALASLSILAEQLCTDFFGIFLQTDYSQAGILGLAIFLTALITNFLSAKTRQIEQLAYQRGLALATSTQLNAQVITVMQEGVIAFDGNFKIQLINSAAEKFLNIDLSNAASQKIQWLENLPSRFQEAFAQHLKSPNQNQIFQVQPDCPDIRLLYEPLRNAQNQTVGSLVFLHDVAKEQQQAQNLKLVALGSLAANIAHEIRNPLSSVSHAAQLLHESPMISAEDFQLTDIIKQNSDRMNRVINNILNLSRKEITTQENIAIENWLAALVNSLSFPHAPNAQIHLVLPPEKPLEKIIIAFDASQLRQVIVNLCENGLRYSLKKTKEAKLTMTLSIESSILSLGITDFGEGLGPNSAKHIFEPFFTTEPSGTGLGLYLAKELCLLNGANLQYLPAPTNGCTFKIQFSQFTYTIQKPRSEFVSDPTIESIGTS